MTQAENTLPYVGVRPQVNVLRGDDARFLISFILLHCPLAILLRASSTVSTVHALLALTIGLLAALTGRVALAIYTCGYIVGAEVLWRMTGGAVLWEFGKYAVILIMVAMLMRKGRLTPSKLPLLYFICIVPAGIYTFLNNEVMQAKTMISFNLSGPIGLFVAAWAFHKMNISRAELIRLMIAMIAPASGVLSLSLFSSLTADEIVFSTESNFVVSGGYGPNQVSTTLALAALLGFFVCLLAGRNCGVLRTGVLGLMVVLVVTSVATFSRGGLLTAGGAGVAAAWYLMRDNRSRIMIIASAILIGCTLLFGLWPWLDRLSEGKLSHRYKFVELTGRGRLFMAELALWKESPIIGLGAGEAKLRRRGDRRPTAVHTEYSRLLAEHGLLGLGACLLLVVLTLRAIRESRSPTAKALTAAFLSWAFLFMLINAMRIAAPGFLIGLATANFLADETGDG